MENKFQIKDHCREKEKCSCTEKQIKFSRLFLIFQDLIRRQLPPEPLVCCANVKKSKCQKETGLTGRPLLL